MESNAPPELPVVDRAADERTTLRQFLDYYRAVFQRKAWGVSDADLARTIHPSDLSLGGLLLHMALVEENWFELKLSGLRVREPWASAPWDDDADWELHVVSEWTHADLHARYEEAVARSRAIEEATESLDQMAAQPARDGSIVSLRWIMVHMIEEYARHCGHADYLREAVDGATGD